ncbi:MAG: chromosomal replication initiator protein DnaA, partial [Nannocystaceae bacterium]
VSLAAPSRFIKDWFEDHYLAEVLVELEKACGHPMTAQIEVDPELERLSSADQTAQGQDEHAAMADPSNPGEAPGATISTPMEPTPARRPSGLIGRYDFDSFILGGSNELAASAARAASENPGQRFNPLFIYGGVGLGKTHLLHAVGHALYERDPTHRISYISAEQFMNEFVTAVRQNRFDEFRARYRNECDCLLVDDIQFIAGRDRTMDEFFHVFNSLYEAGKQIVVTADCVPAQMKGMEERLTSRLNWGLVADIQAPDLETRLAILYEKSTRESLSLAPDVAMEIAKHVKSNVRELEGALVRVTALAELRGCALDPAFVREVLMLRSDPQKAVTVESIQKAVAQYFTVKVADLKGSRRHRAISRPRMIAMYLSRELTGASFPEIGMRFGGKDHSTVINACKRISALEHEDTDTETALTSLRARLSPH